MRPQPSLGGGHGSSTDMSIFRFPGPICQTRHWFEPIDDGTLVTAPSSPPHVVGLAASEEEEPTSAEGNCSFLNPRPTGTVRAPQAAFDRLRSRQAAARISAAQDGGTHRWADGSSSASVAQEIQIDRITIRVVRPVEADARGKNLPTTQELGEALRAIPARQLQHTSRVVLSPRPHPDSTATQTVAGDAGGGEITLYPVNSTQTQNDFDNRVMHESGHNYQGSLWQSAQGVQEWRDAANQDSRLPSAYAGGTTGDDFCEFGILYNTTKGTPCEASARQLYPSRWRKMSEYESR